MIKICKFCGKEFQTKYSKQIYCKGPHYMVCPICGKTYEIKDAYLLSQKPKCCSRECSSIMRSNTSMKLYQCTTPGNSTTARLKAQATMNTKYGVDFAMQSKEIKDKAAKSFHATIWNRKYGDIIPQDIHCDDMEVFILKNDYAEKFIRKYSKDLLIPAKLYAGLVKDSILYRCISFNPYANQRLIIIQDCSLPEYNIIDGDVKIFQELTFNYNVLEIGKDI